MAGPVRLALARANVVITDSLGNALDELTGVQVSVQDGTATARTNTFTDVATMTVEDINQTGRRAFTITGVDGTVWTLTRKCRCGGS
jgi:hypothetical protein